MRDAEAAKYKLMWGNPQYAEFSPGESHLDIFPAEPPGTLVDLGCGTGRAGQALSLRGFTVTLADHVDAREVSLPFRQVNLWEDDFGGPYDHGFCCDVMEHIPPEYVMLTLHNIARQCRHVFFSISNVEDGFGQTIGHPLHLTVKPFKWWRDRLCEVGQIQESRDLLCESIFYIRSRKCAPELRVA